MRRTLALFGLALLIPLAAPAPVPKNVKVKGVIVIREELLTPDSAHTSVVTTVSPDGKVLGELPFRPCVGVFLGPFSPDGSRVVVLTEGPRPKGTAQTWLVHLVDVKKSDILPEPVCTVYTAHVCWSADGQKLYEPKSEGDFLVLEPGKVGEVSITEHDLAKGGKRVVSFGQGQFPEAVSPDGQCWLTRQYAKRSEERGGEWQTFLITPDTAGPVPVCETDFHPLRFLPDGNRVFGVKSSRAKDRRPAYCVLDLLTAKVTPVPWPKELEGKATGTLCLSPDGSEVSVVWVEDVDKPSGWPAHEPCGTVRVGVYELDGGNFRTVYKSTRPTVFGKRLVWAQLAWQ